MSAFSHTSWTVYCNGPGCKNQITDEGGATRKVTRASLRAYLRRHNWVTGIGDGPIPTRKDYCPDHVRLATTEAR